MGASENISVLAVISQKYAVVISDPPVVAHEIHEECVSLRTEGQEALEQVCSHMNYGNFVNYQIAFECPSHPGRDHLCIVRDHQSEKPQIMLYYQKHNNPTPVRMESEPMVWFYKVGYYSFHFYL